MSEDEMLEPDLPSAPIAGPDDMAWQILPPWFEETF